MGESEEECTGPSTYTHKPATMHLSTIPAPPYPANTHRHSGPSKALLPDHSPPSNPTLPGHSQRTAPPWAACAGTSSWLARLTPGSRFSCRLHPLSRPQAACCPHSPALPPPGLHYPTESRLPGHSAMLLLSRMRRARGGRRCQPPDQGQDQEPACLSPLHHQAAQRLHVRVPA